MLVSIIIPTYKDSYYVRNFSLRSVLNQTYSNFEVLIGNDGNNPEIKEYIQNLNDSRIKYWEFKKSNFRDAKEAWCVGGAVARNECLDLVKGNLIAPLDHDDIWGPTYLADRVKFFTENPNVEFTYTKAAYIQNNRVATIFGKSNGEQIPHLTVIYLSKYKNFKYNETGNVAADYLLWEKFKENKIPLTFIDKITSLYNEKNNSVERIENIYFKHFGVNFKKL